MLIKKINFKDTLNIRHRVLWPNKPLKFCQLENDPKGVHYGGYIGNILICVASIFTTDRRTRLRKFATIPEYQNMGYGSKMLSKIIDDLIVCKTNWFWCDARVTAEGFYNRFKMNRCGQIFLKSGVEYIVMEKKIKSFL